MLLGQANGFSTVACFSNHFPLGPFFEQLAETLSHNSVVIRQ